MPRYTTSSLQEGTAIREGASQEASLESRTTTPSLAYTIAACPGDSAVPSSGVSPVDRRRSSSFSQLAIAYLVLFASTLPERSPVSDAK